MRIKKTTSLVERLIMAITIALVSTLVPMMIVPNWMMRVFINDHNDQVVKKLDRVDEWFQHDCNQHDDAAIQADLNCRDSLRLEIDRTDLWIGRLENISPFREITGIGEREICGWYMPWETMSPNEMAKNPRVCL